MAKFMVLYRASATAMEQMSNASPEQAQAGMEMWMQWAGAAGDAVVDLGAPLAPVGSLGKPVSSELPIAGFSILQADTADAVTKLLEDHPHFHSPGDTAIEILEFLAMPGM